MIVKGFRRCSPVEDFAWPRVELGGDGFEVVVGPSREVGAFGEVLAEQSVGVLVGSALPWAVRVSEEDWDAGLEGERDVGGELFASIPRQRTSELCRQWTSLMRRARSSS